MSVSKGFLGRHHSDESKRKMSEKRKGVLFTEEHKRKMRENHVGFGGGHHHTEQSKLKMSIAKKGKPFSVEHKRNMGLAQIGEKNHQWKGGIKKTEAGYLLQKSLNHPCAVRGYVPQHRLVMEAHIGRTLLPTEVVHHINEIRNDNRIENLMLFSGRGSHTNYHKKLQTTDTK